MSTSYTSADDKEKNGSVDHDALVVDDAATAAPDDAVIADRFARYGKLGPVMQRIFASGVEARGVERVPENERETKNVWNKYVSTLTSSASAQCR